MANLRACPHCRREATQALSSNWFPVFTCLECREKYCERDGPPCPACGANDRGRYDAVYA